MTNARQDTGMQDYLVLIFSAWNAAEIFFQLLVATRVGMITHELLEPMKYAQK